MPWILLDHSWHSYLLITLHDNQPETFDQSSGCGGGVRFHLAEAVTKINDLIFVVLARWQRFHAGWRTLLSLSFFPSAKAAWSCRSRSWVTYLGTGGVLYIPIRARTCKAMSKCVERIPGIPLLGPGGLARCWVPGREGRGAVVEEEGGSGADSAADAPLISITSCSHKLNCLGFSAWQHINRALLRQQQPEREEFHQIQYFCRKKAPWELWREQNSAVMALLTILLAFKDK